MGSGSLAFLLAAFASSGAGILCALLLGERRSFAVPVQSVFAAGALLCFLAGALIRVLSFGRPGLLFGAFGNPHSALFREMLCWCLAVFCLLVYLGLIHRGAFQATCRLWCALAALSGFAFALSAASAWMMPWRAAWNTWTVLWPAGGFAALSGSLAFRVAAALQREPPRGMRFPTGPLVLAALCLMALYAGRIGMNPEAAASAGRMLSGDLSPFFWTACAAAGLPLVLEKISRKSWAAAAGFLSVFAASGLFYWTVGELGGSSWSFFG